ncbi:uncharacterized protein LOC111371447 [Olea europaea var. sylvestris]|uniref:uncharacterized protein LOC111371447 n=1 Tax=Olea europaea var. sylvestris TaxID=158386 RepID=UPI000C1D01BD|nr:uncharacterized protein LOC111371447 [Olea europaea var. sylvestris]XP_022849209.1 uncharacterized protein LOC111371447 [Olea europaea var. sylvestris]
MRLVRSMFWSPNARLSRQFQRHIANPRQVYIETSSNGHRSIIKWHGRLFSASVPSDKTEVKKSRKKVSKDERKAMVESFVNKHKAMNAGKFPSAFKAMKEAGGSYYVIRQILQELEYNSKMSSMATKDLSSVGNYRMKKNEMSTEELSSSSVNSQDAQKINKTPMEEDFINRGESSTDAAQVSGNVSTLDAHISEDGQIYNENSVENQNSNYFSTKPQRVVGKSDEILHIHPEKPEDYAKREKGSEDTLQFDGLKPNAQQQKSSRELYKEPIEDAEPEGKSSVWENLKSFANGFLGIWRKR